MSLLIQLAEGISLKSGVMFNYKNPGAVRVPIGDIAHALSNICRFSGHVRHFYSVAQHAVNCSYIVPSEFAFTALMHDTAEAFTNDLPTPLKTAIPEIKDLEIRIETAMSQQFGFTFPLPEEIKLADLQMLKLEKEFLLPNNRDTWAILENVEVEHLRRLVDLDVMCPEEAFKEFTLRYEELTA